MMMMMSHCKTFRQSYFRNKVVQFFCPTVYIVQPRRSAVILWTTELIQPLVFFVIRT